MARYLYFETDCFQSENIGKYPEIGVQLLNVLCAIVSGSQVTHLLIFSAL